MINKDQLRDLMTKVLREMHPVVKYSDDAVEILMMIASHESHLGEYLRQVRGPALGMFQIEPATERDIFMNYLRYNKERDTLIKSYMTNTTLPDLEFNLAYQIALARVHLTRKPGALPRDPIIMARYLKEHWNTTRGDATYRDYLTAYEERAL